MAAQRVMAPRGKAPKRPSTGERRNTPACRPTVEYCGTGAGKVHHRVGQTQLTACVCVAHGLRMEDKSWK